MGGWEEGWMPGAEAGAEGRLRAPHGTHPARWASARPQQARRGRLQPIPQKEKLRLQGTETPARGGGQLGAWGHTDLGSNVLTPM